jgi:hypothetical protein
MRVSRHVQGRLQRPTCRARGRYDCLAYHAPRVFGLRRFDFIWRRMSCLFRSIAAVGSICMPVMSPVQAEAPASGSPLTLEYALKSPGYAISHGWSADSRRVAILFSEGSVLYEKSAIYTLDVASRNIAAPLADGRPSEHVALNGDGMVLAATASREARIYSTDNLDLVARAQAPVTECFFGDGASAVFSTDATSFWVRCRRDVVSGPQQSTARTVALRYRLPNLELVEKITASEPTNTTWQPRGSIRLVDQLPILTGVTHSRDDKGSRGTIRFAVECFSLDRRKPCFDSFELTHRPNVRDVLNFSPSLSLAAIISDRATDFPASYIDIYDTALKKAITSINITAPIAGAIPQALEFISDARYLVGAFTASKKNDGGMAVWDVQSTEVRQTFLRGPVRQMSASPDGNKLLAVTKAEILIYRVAR